MKPLSETYKELGIDFKFPIKIEDANGNRTYFEDGEDGDGYWSRREYDANGNQTYWENSDGFWYKYEYDANGKKTYFESFDGMKKGTPRSQSCDGKVIQVDGKKYQLKEL
jgi:YD repeat-containing protein